MSRRSRGRTRGRRRGGRGMGRRRTPPPTQPSPPPPPPPPPPPTIPTINHRSAWGILRHAAIIFCSHPITFLVSSFLLCSLRSNIEELYHPISNQSDLYRMKVPFFDSFEHTFSRNETNSRPFLRIDFPSSTEFPDLNTIDSDNRHVVIDFDEINSRRLLARYSLVLCATELVYAWLRGVVFLQVLDHFERKEWCLIATIGTGLWIGFLGNFWISVINMALRIGLLRIILKNSDKIGNFYILLVIVTRWLFTPFMNKAPWVPLPDQWGTIPLMGLVLCIDMMLGLMCSVGSSAGLVHGEMRNPVAIMDIVKETFHLLVVSLTSAVEIRVIEAIICGAVGRGMLWSILGNLGSLAVQCVMEVFFLVAWVVYYLSARNLLGYPELVGFLEELSD